MLEGVGVYQDRDKYLLRSLQVTGRMENLMREMLAISRMESGSAAVRQEPVDLSALMEQQLALDAGAAGAAGAAAGVRTDPGDHRHRRRLPAGQGRGEPALQRLPLLPGGGGDPGVVRPAGGPPRPDGGEHRGPHQRRRPCPTCLRPSTGRRAPGTGAPAAAAWGSIW